ncbi:MAG: helix-turn-helix transcriptional regulator [Bacillota bacterium]|nr:helix-turn-helix transcriptional regulator [Bacillota bacterium]
MTLGEKLQGLRKSKAMSQEDLAANLKVSRQTISRWEQDQALPDLSNIIALAKVFNISIDDLVGIDIEDINKNQEGVNLSKDLFAYKMKFVFGIILLSLGLVLAIGLSIYGSLVGGYLVRPGQPDLQGLSAFLYIKELYWVYFLAAAFGLLGLGLVGAFKKLKIVS